MARIGNAFTSSTFDRFDQIAGVVRWVKRVVKHSDPDTVTELLDVDADLARLDQLLARLEVVRVRTEAIYAKYAQYGVADGCDECACLRVPTKPAPYLPGFYEMARRGRLGEEN